MAKVGLFPAAYSYLLTIRDLTMWTESEAIGVAVSFGRKAVGAQLRGRSVLFTGRNNLDIVAELDDFSDYVVRDKRIPRGYDNRFSVSNADLKKLDRLAVSMRGDRNHALAYCLELEYLIIDAQEQGRRVFIADHQAQVIRSL